MSRKVLPISKPAVKCFLYDACPLSILANTEDYLGWFYSNYIQLFCSKNVLDDGFLFLEFYGKNQAFTSPWLKRQHLSRQALAHTQQDIVRFVIENINLEYYFYGHLDDFYVPFREGYQSYHFMHDLMIYGYDEEERKFYALAYDQDSMFGNFEISFSAFEQGVKAGAEDPDMPYWYDWVYLFKFNAQGQYEFDLKLVEELLHDYLWGINTSEKDRTSSNPWPNRNKAFGMEVYPYMKIYYEHLLNHKMKFDIRIMSLLIEHKSCMLQRIKYLQEKGYIEGLEPLYQSYAEVEKKFNIFLSLMIKYRVTGKSACIENIIHSLDEVAHKERLILTALLEKIREKLALRDAKEEVMQ